MASADISHDPVLYGIHGCILFNTELISQVTLQPSVLEIRIQRIRIILPVHNIFHGSVVVNFKIFNRLVLTCGDITLDDLLVARHVIREQFTVR